MVRAIDLAAGKHVLPAGEGRRQGTAQHEHLWTTVAVADQHHRGRRPDRHLGGALAFGGLVGDGGRHGATVPRHL